MSRWILHIDLDAFFCAVEELRCPELRGKPFAVGGKPEQRGVVSSCSYPARLLGVRSAMPMRRALQLCPQLQIVPPDHAEYERLSAQVMEIVRQLTPQVEQISIDEAFLELAAGEQEEPLEAARQLQRRINAELGLPCSIGVASNKLMAKIANDVGKARRRSADPPNAITFVPRGEEAAFLADLPVIALWGVGPKTAARLNELGIQTIGELARWSEVELIRRFGKQGSHLYRSARGIDDSPLIVSRAVKSISQEVTFARDLSDGGRLRQTLRQLCAQVSQRLRQQGQRGKTVKLKLRWANFQTVTRQATLSQPTDQEAELYAAAERLFSGVWKPGAAVRLLGVGVSGFEVQARQLSLWEAASERDERLEQALEALRQRYGEAAPRRAGKR